MKALGRDEGTKTKGEKMVYEARHKYRQLRQGIDPPLSWVSDIPQMSRVKSTTRELPGLTELPVVLREVSEEISKIYTAK